MEKIFRISKAMFLAMCVSLAMITLGGCDDDENGGGGDYRDNYVGTYTVTETFVGGLLDEYQYTITKSSTSPNDILVNNFYNQSQVTLIITVTGDSFTIPSQAFLGGAYAFVGSGRREGNYLIYTITVTESGYAPFSVSATARKL